MECLLRTVGIFTVVALCREETERASSSPQGHTVVSTLGFRCLTRAVSWGGSMSLPLGVLCLHDCPGACSSPHTRG